MDAIPLGQQVADLRRRKDFSQDGLAYPCRFQNPGTAAEIMFMASGKRCCDGRPHSGAGKEKPS